MKFIKSHGGLVPFGPDAEQWLAATKLGQVVESTFTRPRNYLFHKKYFGLLNYAFDQWDIPDNDAAKDFDKFRSDLCILAGYYEMVVQVDGSVVPKAKSISFANMKEEEFQRLYSKTVDILLEKILDTHTEEDIQRIMTQMLGFL